MNYKYHIPKTIAKIEEELRKAFVEGAMWWSDYTKVSTWDGMEKAEEEAKKRFKQKQ